MLGLNLFKLPRRGPAARAAADPSLARLGWDLPLISMGHQTGSKLMIPVNMDWSGGAAGPGRWQVLLLHGKTVSASFQQQKK